MWVCVCVLDDENNVISLLLEFLEIFNKYPDTTYIIKTDFKGGEKGEYQL